MIKTLEIELRSDLCAGTGKGFASVIDLDTSVDEYGIPFIPSKRIKGCLREIAKRDLCLEEKEIISIFGESGSGQTKSLSISDAKIYEYDDQLEEIKAAIYSKSKTIKANDITELFCSVRSETAIENDTAKDKSLRFTRVVNRLSPIDQRPLKFYATVEFDDNYENTITNLCKCLRNIGYKRNRGFGYVNCILRESAPGSTIHVADSELQENKYYKLNYLVYLEDDLMLPASDANHSLDYIPGTSVLGALAGKYIKDYGKDGFNDIFLSNNARFGNLYVSDKDGTDYYPAPRFLAKIKAADESEKGIQNMVANKKADEEKDEDKKPQYKPLKKGYISDKKGYNEVSAEIVYHNALNTDDGGLYTQYCVSSGQYFKGYIEANGTTMKKIIPLFSNGTISFGRSKTAQYSHCVIKKIDLAEIIESKINIEAGKTAAYLCESDIALVTDSKYTIECEDLCKALSVESGSLSEFTSLSSRVISGYNAKWNHKKPQFPVIKAGSVVVFSVSSSEERPEFTLIGERLNEGYGRVRLIADTEAYSVVENTGELDFDIDNVKSELLKAVIKRKKIDILLGKAISEAETVSIDSSQIGRITLMCKEASDYSDFIKRIESIKTDDVRNKALKYFAVDKVSQAEDGSIDWNTAKEYILAVLTIAKYRKKADKKDKASAAVKGDK